VSAGLGCRSAKDSVEPTRRPLDILFSCTEASRPVWRTSYFLRCCVVCVLVFSVISVCLLSSFRGLVRPLLWCFFLALCVVIRCASLVWYLCDILVSLCPVPYQSMFCFVCFCVWSECVFCCVFLPMLVKPDIFFCLVCCSISSVVFCCVRGARFFFVCAVIRRTSDCLFFVAH